MAIGADPVNSAALPQAMSKKVTGMKKAVLVIFLTMFSLVCFTQATKAEDGPKKLDGPSKEIGQIIDQLKYKGNGPDWMLDVSGLKVFAEDMAFRGMDYRNALFADSHKSGEYDWYTVPYPKGTPDIFVHTVIFDKDTREFWIEQTGGMAFGYTVYGPGRLDDAGKARKE